MNILQQQLDISQSGPKDISVMVSRELYAHYHYHLRVRHPLAVSYRVLEYELGKRYTSSSPTPHAYLRY
jgi:hypothetical protein